MNSVVKTYKGYEIHPLVYPRRPADGTTRAATGKTEVERFQDKPG